MLSSLKQSNSRVAGRTALVLASLAIGGLAVLALKWVSEDPNAGLAKPSAGVAEPLAGGATALLVDDQPGANPADASSPKPENPAEPAVAVEYFPRPAEAELQIVAALEKPVDVDFQKMPLEKCIEALASQARIDVWLDKPKLTEEGVAVDHPITLKLKGRRLESALNLLLQPAQLTYLYEDEVLKITTLASAADVLITRTYPVGDLFPDFKVVEEKSEPKTADGRTLEPTLQPVFFQGFGGGGMGPGMGGGMGGGFGGGGGGGGRGGDLAARRQNINTLMHAISSTVEPDTWEELSGPGSMMPVVESRSLVIRQTWSVHKKVLQLLRDLRAAKRMQPAAATKTKKV